MIKKPPPKECFKPLPCAPDPESLPPPPEAWLVKNLVKRSEDKDVE